MNLFINWQDLLDCPTSLNIPQASSYWGWKRPTFAGCRWDSNAHKVLEGQHAGQKAAVLGPDLSDGFPPAFIHDRYQSEGVKHGVEVHPLANDIDAQKQTRLRDRGDTDTAEEGVVWTFSSKKPSPPLFKIPLGRTCKRSSWWSTWRSRRCQCPDAAAWCRGRWCARLAVTVCSSDGSISGGGRRSPQTLAGRASAGCSAQRKFNFFNKATS